MASKRIGGDTMGKRMRVTKKEAVRIFMDQLRGNKPQGAGKVDRVALCEAWHNYVDSLCKDGLVTEKQADAWTNPFHT